MNRTFGQLQQDLANNPILVANQLSPRRLEAGQYLCKMVDSELYEQFLGEFPAKFQDLVGTGFGYHCTAFCKLYKGDKEEALADIVTAIRIRTQERDEGLWASHTIHGRILDMLWDDYRGALAAFKRALALRPGESITVVGMLCAASKHRDEPTCVSAVEELIKTSPAWATNDWVADRLRRDTELVFARTLNAWAKHISGVLNLVD